MRPDHSAARAVNRTRAILEACGVGVVIAMLSAAVSEGRTDFVLGCGITGTLLHLFQPLFAHRPQTPADAPASPPVGAVPIPPDVERHRPDCGLGDWPPRSCDCRDTHATIASQSADPEARPVC